MNVNEIIVRVTRVFGDDAKVQITDDDIIRWINDAQRDIAANNNLFRVTANTIVPSGEYTFVLPPNLFTLHNIKADGITLRMLSQQEADSYIVNNDDSSQAAQGTPTHFWQWGNTIHLYPLPSRDCTVTVYYTRAPQEVNAITDTPEVPLIYHNRLVEYCMTQAYELDDNMYGYQVKKAEFENNTQKTKDNQEWTDREFYPMITSSPADISDYYEGYW